jgi:hypothetical protein
MIVLLRWKIIKWFCIILLSDLLVSLESRIRIIRRGFDVLRMENRNLKRNLKNAEKEIRRLNHIMYSFEF